MLNKDDGIFLPSIEGVVSGKTSQVAGMNEILNKLIGNDNYLDKRKMSIENTIEDLKNSKKYKLGDVVEVLGFHAKGDGSHHKRIAKAEDDGSGEQGQDGIWWCIVHSGEVNVSWFGASESTEDNSPFFEKAINTATKINIKGKYKTTKKIIIKKAKLHINFHDSYIQCYDTVFMKFENDAQDGLIENGTIVMRTLDSTGVIVGETTSTTPFLNAFKIKNVYMQGAKLGFELNNVRTIDVLECRTIHCENAISLNKVVVCNVERCDFIQGTVYNYGTGAKTLTSNESVVFRHNRFYGFEIGASLSGLLFGVFVDNDVDACRSYGCKVGLNVTNFNIERNWFSVIRQENNNSITTCLDVSGDTISPTHYYGEIYIKDNFFRTTANSSGTKINHSLRIYRGQRIFVKNNTFFGENAIYNILVNDAIVHLDSNQILGSNTSIRAEESSTLYMKSNWLAGLLTLVNNSKASSDNDVSLVETLDKTLTITFPAGVNEVEFSTPLPFIANSNIGNYEVITTNSTGSYVGNIEYKNGSSTGKIILKKTTAFGVNVGLRIRIRFNTIVETANVLNSYFGFNIDSLDTPYYTLKMQEQGIYSDYITYRDELHEYENSQVADETMLLPVLQEPEIPESVRTFAEKYKLI